MISQLDRQNHQCYGCLKPINEESPTFVGGPMLCQLCADIFGPSNPMQLRRLMALHDYKKNKHNVYLISSLKNSSVVPLGNELRKHPEFDIMDEWITPGPPADDNWQAYEEARERSWTDAMRSRGCQNIFMFDRAYMDHADTVVLVMPGGKSAMCELGYAAGRGKNTVIFMNNHQAERYEVMPNFAQHIVHTQDELVSTLKEIHNGTI